MKKIITTEAIPIKLWLEDVDDGALEQAKNLANLPFAFHHIAIMPDCHIGYGMPIGGILAAKDYIVPNAVGVDIGCGMTAVRTNLSHIDRSKLKQILGGIRLRVPMGFKRHKRSQDEKHMPKGVDDTKIAKQQYSKALKQIGTLGGGNHFIEILKGTDNFIYIMLHSGSRNIGYQVADYYNKLAITLNTKLGNTLQIKQELAALLFDSTEGQDYFSDMEYCVRFACQNRFLMMERVKEILLAVIPNTRFEPTIDIAHNFASIETHFGQSVVVHRKGATQAQKGQIGIVPGSQGTASYIVKGKGNKESFCSCAHGAGRVLGRKEAQRTLDLKEETKKLEKLEILHSIRGAGDLDEAPSAYKDIGKVMENQKDLVEILVKLMPLGVVQG